MANTAPTWKLKRLNQQHCVDEFARGQLDLPYSGIVVASMDGSAADPAPFEFALRNAQGIMVVIDVTAISGAGAQLVVNVDAFDESRPETPPTPSGVFGGSSNIPAITTVTTVLFMLNPWLAQATTSGGSFSSIRADQRGLHRNYRIRPVKGGTTTTLQYSIGLHVT